MTVLASGGVESQGTVRECPLDIEQLYKQFAPMVYRRCLRLLGNPERAREAMQDVFVKVLTAKGQLTDAAPSALLYQVATNTCLNIIRSSRSRPEVPDSDLILTIALSDSHEEQAVTSIFVKTFMRKQVASTRLIATLFFLDGLTLEQVAKEVNLSVSGVRKRLQKFKDEVAKERLQDG